MEPTVIKLLLSIDKRLENLDLGGLVHFKQPLEFTSTNLGLYPGIGTSTGVLTSFFPARESEVETDYKSVSTDDSDDDL